MTLHDKYKKLLEYIKSLESVVIAFSGGVDSTFLLQAAKEALGDQAMALTIKAPFHLQWEIEETKELTTQLGISHVIIEHKEIPDEIQYNPSDRCYLCKKKVFQGILDFAKENNFLYVADGTNFDDTKDYRPGMKALKELNVVSPLLEVGFTKDEIRQMSKILSLPTWDKPAYACILTRIQYGQKIIEEDLRKVEKAEKYLIDLGFPVARVRLHDQLARIEVAPDRLKDLLEEKQMKKISVDFKAMGFQYVTVDLEGYRTGSQNEVLS
ncbi:ATP-dependent sacrificial sulfur transferase LarE [Clostridium formicaceticum]|uniref:GMP synthase subunit B n=1 Tax=Clostridium formicaceticum TaxID=1497 RepID=A0AAC9RIV3_9CLOT|nr:ATP-dependent sacrificial sulfur transferase LarE [Clostridium formicaceticum]AOY75916.1 TIGR00268 family protein [Clostridium formicaceticum]ARE86260.1 GMP synthase subunit B [Clostridium formicaceticum]